MQRFRFSLEAALGVRERQAEIEEVKLQGLEGQRQAVQRKRAQLEQENQDLANTLRSIGTNQVPAASGVAFNQVAGYTNRLILEDQELAHQESQLAHAIAEQRQLWQEARQRVELLKKLKEKAKAEWQLGMDREEQLLAEELFLHKWNHENGA